MLTLLTLALVFWFCPFICWSAAFTIAKATIRQPNVPFRTRVKLLWWLTREIMMNLLLTPLWYIEEIYLFFSKDLPDKPPTFIISSPRSGSTYLHRTLANNAPDEFFAITYLEWRYPYITFWWLLDKLHLRRWFENRCYWPDTSIGREAQRMHPHTYGDYEEHGIFVEEKFFTHYFIFRRYPFLPVMNIIQFYHLPERVRERIVRAMEAVVHRVATYRGRDRSWLTKENECADLYRLLLEFYPDARLVFLTRDQELALASYDRLSIISTAAKTELNPSIIPYWHDANRTFRHNEHLRFMALRDEYYDEGIHIDFDELVATYGEIALSKWRDKWPS